MSSVTVIKSFRVLLSNLLDKQVMLSDDELDEMSSYLLRKDFSNIELLEEEIAVRLRFLADTMDEENFTKMEEVLQFFDIKTESIIQKVKEEIKKKNRKSRMILNIDGITMWVDLRNLTNVCTVPYVSSDFEKEVRRRMVAGEMEEVKAEIFRQQNSSSTVSADGELSMESV